MIAAKRRQVWEKKAIFDQHRSRPHMPKEIISEFGNRSIENFLNQNQMEKNNENIQNIKKCVTWAFVIFAKI